METKFTPSPWVAAIDEDRKYFQIETGMHAIVTNSSCYEPFNPANAHLIAAAPDMYEALKAILYVTAKTDSGEVCQEDNFDYVRAAIAKAEGK